MKSFSFCTSYFREKEYICRIFGGAGMRADI